MSSRKKGPKTRPSELGSAIRQSMAEQVIRPNSQIRKEYDRRGCKPSIRDIQQGRPAIEVAGHIIARLQQVGSDAPGLVEVSERFRDNALAVRIIDIAG